MSRSLRAEAAILALSTVGVLAVGCGSLRGYDDLGPEWSGDGRMIAFTRIYEGQIGDLYVMRPDRSGIRLVAKDAESWVWSPDGEQIAFHVLGEDYSSEIWLFTARDGSLTRLTRNAIDDEGPAWSPDGRRLAFIRGGIAEPSTLVVMDLATKNVRVVWPETDDTSDKLWPTWSPDGRRVAFVAGIFPQRLFVVRADGRAHRKIERSRTFESVGPPEWSPDGQRILFNAGPVGSRDDGYLSDQEEIYAVRADGSGLKRLTRNAVWDSVLAISPNGECLLVWTGPVAEPSRTETHLLRADGTGRRRLAKSAAEALGGDWSPDGRRIAIARDLGDGSRIVVMDARGRQKWQLAGDRCRTAPEKER